jgi:hypothetical protein
VVTPGAQRRGKARDTAEASSVFAAEAARLRNVLAAGRSAVFLQLFDLLIERSLDERAPKEIEIAHAIFGQEAARNTLHDSSVRVYVHRLRKRLDEFYSGQPGPRLQILKGEYRIVLSSAESTGGRYARLAWPAAWGWREAKGWWLTLGFVLVLNGLAWSLHAPARDHLQQGPGPATTGYWSPTSGDAPTVVVVGDSYMVAQTENQRDIKRLVQDPAIRSRDDLGGYLKTHPKAFYELYDLDIHYAPIGTALATWEVLPTLSQVHRDRGVATRLMSSSRLTAQTLKSNDIVYIGQVSSLGILASPLLRASGFGLGQTRGDLIDQVSGKRYAADVGAGREGQSRIDYGYVASLPGPSGKHIFVISGLGDAGVQSMAALAANRAQIDALAKRSGAETSFEALYAVQAMGDALLDRSLIVVRPLRPAAVWDIRPAQN